MTELSADYREQYARDMREAKTDKERRAIHARSVQRADIIRSGRSAAEVIVSRFQTDVVSIVSAARVGEEGLVTERMVNDLREALDLLEGEL